MDSWFFAFRFLQLFHTPPFSMARVGVRRPLQEDLQVFGSSGGLQELHIVHQLEDQKL